ncbi:UNVERIFIED_CONTAM: hypothetical protein GTU68_054768 [Idotea baltica]|nr:hypothetical protein [Idotea baltica]
MIHQIHAIDDPFRLADAVIVHLNIKLEEKQQILETNDAGERLEKIFGHMKSEIEILQVEKRIRTRVKKQMEKTQKEYYLNEQMRAIQKELGEKDDFRNEIQELEDKLKAKDMPEEAREKTDKEIRKLKQMSPMSAEATVVRNYVDWMLSLPWNEYSDDKIEIDEASAVLEEDHYGLIRVKERILEHLAVHKLVGKIRGPILCLVGPPGVGKTSLGKSIAKATGREFVRIALGGVRDEAEIRGHRRTYIGALPGKIAQSLKRAGTSNPVFLLDEIDKMSQDFRGDPSSALLEVLDPEQNSEFNDHYLDVDYDLSKVMFITTANYEQNIPRPLLDRMEVIRLAGYTEPEKLEICKTYLIPKACETNGLKPEQIEFDDSAVLAILRYYTREAGVRTLERTVSAICRKVAVDVVRGEEEVDIHIHVPEGAVPKDGPSAGVAMITAITSALTGVPVDRNIAMTGEITLRGRVLPIGGLKEKILAAHRGGITRVLIPKDNEKDIEEIPASVRAGLEIITVGNADEVLREALFVEGPEHYMDITQERKIRNELLFGKPDDKSKVTPVPPTEDGSESEIRTH